MMSRQMRRRNRLVALVVVVLAVASFGVWWARGMAVAESGDRLPGTVAKPTEVHEADGPVNAGDPAFYDSVSLTAVADNGMLRLVNGTYEVRGEPVGLVSAWPTVDVRAQDILIDATTLAALESLFAAAERDGVTGLYLSSGYRDYDTQVQTYDTTVDKSLVQPPGHSEHQTGLAADLMVSGFGQDDLAGSAAGLWLAENSWRFGLILRYPPDKQDITGISEEAWHFRYIGQPHAWYCHQYGLAFEEYIQFLHDSGDYQVTLDGVDYSVSYQTPLGDTLNVPGTMNYVVSSDNTGGYIVTAWR